jgi:serine/threonine-protein kinase
VATASLLPAIRGYRLDRVLRHDETGATYLAEEVACRRFVSLKVPAPELASDQRFRARFPGDCLLVAEIDHPGVLPVFGCGDADGSVWAASKFVEGTDLATVLAEGPLAAEPAVAIVEQVAAALHAAHSSGIVHRGLRPAVVLLEAGTHHVFVTDFGIPGPPDEYAAPERIAGERLDGRADVYSLGRVLARCLPDDDFGPVVHRATADDAEERFRTTVELARACRQVLASRPVEAAPTAIPDKPGQRNRRQLLLVAAAGLLVAAAAAAFLLTTHHGMHSPRATAPAAPPSRPVIPGQTATALSQTIEPIPGAVNALAAAAELAPKPAVVFDRITGSGDGVRYRSTPNHWCGSGPGNPVPQTDPCWRDVLPGVGAAEGQLLRIYCYAAGTPVHGDALWAKVRLQPVEYVPAAFLAASRSGRLAGATSC